MCMDGFGDSNLVGLGDNGDDKLGEERKVEVKECGLSAVKKDENHVFSLSGHIMGPNDAAFNFSSLSRICISISHLFILDACDI